MSTPTFDLAYPDPRPTLFWSPIISGTDVATALGFAVFLFVLRWTLTKFVYMPVAVSFGVKKLSFREKLVRAHARAVERMALARRRGQCGHGVLEH